jgi:hypothetical protein
MTLRKDCKCACDATAVVHVHPCCGPGSEGWANIVLPDEDPYKTLSLFWNGNKIKSTDTTQSNKPARKSPDPNSVHYQDVRLAH